MTTIQWDSRTWAHLTCGKCGIEWMVPGKFNDEKKETRDDFYCPNGHCRAYKESTIDQLRRRAERAEQEQARLADRARQEQERAAKAERALSRHKKRSAAGTCPCCKRTFSNMARHMKHRHPEFVQDTGAKVVPIARKEPA